MKGTITMTNLDRHKQEIGLQGFNFVSITVNDIEYRIKTYDDEDGIHINVDSRLVVYPKASNEIVVKGD